MPLNHKIHKQPSQLKPVLTLFKNGKQTVEAKVDVSFKKGKQAGKTCLQVFPKRRGRGEIRGSEISPPPFNLKSDHFFAVIKS